jgi:hypothetical protein
VSIVRFTFFFITLSCSLAFSQAPALGAVTQRCFELFPEKLVQSTTRMLFNEVPRRICFIGEDSQKTGDDLYAELIDYSAGDIGPNGVFEKTSATIKLRISESDATAIRPYFKASIEKFGLAFVPGNPLEPGGWNKSMKEAHALSTLGTEFKIIKNEGASSLIANGTLLIGEDRYFFLQQPLEKISGYPCWTELF